MESESLDPAPEFPADLPWLNVGHPVRLREDLRGHIVVLHFFCASSIHCQQVLPTLAYLEQRFGDRPVCVLGVHSAKFTAEADPDVVRAAVLRLGVRHPVVIDRDRQLWNAWSCRAWPTLVLVDEQGRIRFRGPGEPERDRLVGAVEVLLRGSEASGDFAALPFRGLPERLEPPPTGMRYPTRLCVDAERELLWVADTGHHRVVALELESGRIAHVVGHGLPGASDGDLASAGFAAPRGLATAGDLIYVADAGNHALRVIDPGAAAVTTVLGAGRKGEDYTGGELGRDQALCSPWDLAPHGDMYLAMAGAHQIWRFDAETGGATALLGTGAEALQDGCPGDALLAQPVAVAVSGNELAVVDAATSAVRIVDLDELSLATLVGSGPFAFGDVDGPLVSARLQQPMDVAFWRGGLLVVDTLNHKVKWIDRAAGAIRTLIGPEHGLRLPEGLAVHGDVLFVADTGNHRILRFRLGADTEVTPAGELAPSGLLPPRPRRELPPVELQAYGGIVLRIRLPFPHGERLHPDTPVLLAIREAGEDPVLAQDIDQAVDVYEGQAEVDYLSLASPGEGAMRLSVSYLTCLEPDGVAHRQILERTVPVRLGDEGRSELIVD